LTTDLSSRGIDIPDVDWIIQFDPPQWSESFVHRIGRTARAGRHGQSILYLAEPEYPYINFLRGKKVEINEYTPVSE
jgi:superfamily II DNA/RNA helicase